ncbi:hypothetical protein VZT92_017344 [Zoarces viviparus]|uniref:Immunoglobulin V-set domain-containing protein n=1 Tax=Zoarces viviparus TaxID=48416 RepID=A0AAW1EQZ5_ZOAVI
MICSILLLITLTSCVSASLVVNVTQSSYQAKENHNVTLEWTFTTRTDGSLKSLNILCEMLTDVRPFVLFDLREGVEVPESRHERFAGRVQFDKDVLREGRLRLHMSRLRTADSGVYLCDVFTGDDERSKTCHLKVTAARATTLRRDPPPTESGTSPESLGGIGLFCGLGLPVVLVLFLIALYIKNKISTQHHKIHDLKHIKTEMFSHQVFAQKESDGLQSV